MTLDLSIDRRDPPQLTFGCTRSLRGQVTSLISSYRYGTIDAFISSHLCATDVKHPFHLVLSLQFRLRLPVGTRIDMTCTECRMDGNGNWSWNRISVAALGPFEYQVSSCWLDQFVDVCSVDLFPPLVVTNIKSQTEGHSFVWISYVWVEHWYGSGDHFIFLNRRHAYCMTRAHLNE